MAKIWGYVANDKGRVIQTEKAVRVTIRTSNGETVHIDTTWIPKSICQNMKITRVDEDGSVGFEFSATVPDWWIGKFDTRPAWAKRGERSAPMAQRPW